MSKKIIILSLLAASPAYATILSVTVTNLEGTQSEFSSVVMDNTGALVSAGSYVGLGVFDIDNASISALATSSSLASSFYALESSSFSFDGGFQYNADGNSDDLYDGVNSYSGLNAYVVVGNGTTLANSSEFLVWDSGVSFEGTEPIASPTDVLLDTGTGSLIIGSEDLYTFDLSSFGGSATEAAFSTAQLVPEPSSSALLAIAGVGFILRRRR